MSAEPTTTPTTPTPPAAAADAMRTLAFDGIYLLPGASERTGVDPGSEQLLEKLLPVERERVLRVASRRLAFQVLFEIDARGITDMAFVPHTLGLVEGLGPVAMDRIGKFIIGAYTSRGAADAAFRVLAPEWPTYRLAGVDRAILRLCHYELTTRANPPAIIVNEAVELAKHFSTEKSPGFINALLDKVAKAMPPESAAPAGGSTAPASPASPTSPTVSSEGGA